MRYVRRWQLPAVGFDLLLPYRCFTKIYGVLAHSGRKQLADCSAPALRRRRAVRMRCWAWPVLALIDVSDRQAGQTATSLARCLPPSARPV